MAGIYIHFPFCLRKCPYCDFYSVDRLELLPSYVSALKREMDLSAGILAPPEDFQTVFFGGGTPSLLPADTLILLMEHVKNRFPLSADAEITMEANPASIKSSTLERYREAGINRLSIGIQSFVDKELEFLKRLHTSADGEMLIHEARKSGFENIGIDLIFGLPGQTPEHWRESVARSVSLGVQHISTYCLTLHPGTPFGDRAAGGDLSLPDEKWLCDLMLWTDSFLTSAGFTHYEVSNFSRPGYQCRHNMGYWKGEPYLGFGPSAHSCTGGKRFWNSSDIEKYITVLSHDRLPQREAEILTDQQKRIEKISLGLRLSEGIPVHWLGERDSLVPGLVEAGYAFLQDGCLSLTPRGSLVADEIALELV